MNPRARRRLDGSLYGKASGGQGFRPAPGHIGRAVLLFAAISTLAGCPATPPPAPPTPAPKPAVRKSIANLPVSLTVKQRSTTPIPNSLPSLSLTVDDITRGQVLVTLVDGDGKPVLASTSLEEGKSTRFTYGEEAYTLTLTRLDNALVGEDFASIRIDREAAVPARNLSEKEKIHALIDHVAAQSGAVFVRNGTKYSPAEAAKHLQQKWDAGGDQIQTASQFIKEIASSSSISGEPYRIEWPDGKSATAEVFLTDHLKQLEPPEPPPATAPK